MAVNPLQIKYHSLTGRMTYDRVYQAFLNVKRNKGAAGVDKPSIQMFEAHLDQNLAALMRDVKKRGKFSPQPLRRVTLDKGKGKFRPLGIEEAQSLKQAIAAHLEECGLELHPEKTKMAYCKDDNRTGYSSVVSFDFLGYCFRARLSRNRQGKYFVNFSPAIAPKARKSICAKIRDWRIPRRCETSMKALAHMINPAVRGWIEYYGAFYKSSLLFLVHHLERLILK